MTFLRFEVEPVSKLRARTVRTNKGHFRSFTPKKTKQFENTIKGLCRSQFDRDPYTGALSVSIEFELPKPKSVTRKYPTVKPDIDNLVKSLVDSLNGIVWKDDCQIVNLNVSKRYSKQGSILVTIKHVI